jgi:hypothetical protein
MNKLMSKPMVLTAIAMLAIGVVAGRSMTPAVSPAMEQAVAKSITPFEMMQYARGLSVQVIASAF